MKKFVVILFFAIIILLVDYMPDFKNVIENKEKQGSNYQYNIFDYYPIIGHALYGINNKSYGNCLECLEEGYKKGIRLIEADFLFTSDGDLILNHFWEDKVLDKKTFLNNKIYGKYTPMNLSMLLEKMMEYKDIYIIVDTKEDEYGNDIYKLYRQLIEDAGKIDDSLPERFIPQYYNYEMYYKLKNIYDFKYDMVTLYKWPYLDINMIVNFCIQEDIDAITIPSWVYTDEFISNDVWKALRDSNIKVYVHTINDQEEYDLLKISGVDGIYTDFLN